jgi:site-specific DNA recombinase
MIERFARGMREKLTTGEVPFRKAYLGSIVDRIEVDDRRVRIMGRTEILEQAALANGDMPRVHGFVPKWRASLAIDPEKSRSLIALQDWGRPGSSEE